MNRNINIINHNSSAGRIGPDRSTYAGAAFSVKSVAAYLLDTFLTWQERQRQRRELMSLDSRLLRDIGISRTDAEREYRKPFWQS